MARSFIFELKELPEALIERARKTAKNERLAFDGDAREGNLIGHGFEGVYEITDGKVAITINKKPPLIPWFAVESKIRNFLA